MQPNDLCPSSTTITPHLRYRSLLPHPLKMHRLATIAHLMIFMRIPPISPHTVLRIPDYRRGGLQKSWLLSGTCGLLKKREQTPRVCSTAITHDDASYCLHSNSGHTTLNTVQACARTDYCMHFPHDHSCTRVPCTHIALHQHVYSVYALYHQKCTLRTYRIATAAHVHLVYMFHCINMCIPCTYFSHSYHCTRLHCMHAPPYALRVQTPLMTTVLHVYLVYMFTRIHWMRAPPH